MMCVQMQSPHMIARGQPGTDLSMSFAITNVVFFGGLSLNLKVIISTRLPGKQDPGVHLFLPRHQDYKPGPAMPKFYMDSGDLNLGPYAWKAKLYQLNHLPIPPYILNKVCQWLGVCPFHYAGCWWASGGSACSPLPNPEMTNQCHHAWLFKKNTGSKYRT